MPSAGRADLHLGVLLDRYDPTLGGAERATDLLVRRALAQGGRVSVATLSGAAPEGASTLRVAAPRRRPARDRAFARAGVEALRAAGCGAVLAFRHAPDCDVYLPHGGLVADARAAADASRGGVGPLRRLARAWSGKERFFEEAEAALLGAAGVPLVIAVSRGLAERVVARYPATRGRVRVIPNGVDASAFQRGPFAAEGARLRARLAPPGSVLCLLSAHRPRLKGLETALRALARPEVAALSPPFHLLVVGREVDRALRRLPARLGLAGRVTWHPLVADPRPLYAAADLLLQPTWHDPCSLTSLEALAMSLPVITTVRDGVAELMGREGGIPVEAPGDPEAVALALRVLADPDLRRHTAEGARFVAEKNRLSTRLDQILEACHAVAAAREAPRVP